MSQVDYFWKFVLIAELGVCLIHGFVEKRQFFHSKLGVHLVHECLFHKTVRFWFSFSLWHVRHGLFARTMRVVRTVPAMRSLGLVDLCTVYLRKQTKNSVCGAVGWLATLFVCSIHWFPTRSRKLKWDSIGVACKGFEPGTS